MARFSSLISSKVQITNPIEIRKRRGIKPSDRFEIVEQEDGIFLRPAKLRFADLAGIVPALKGREHVDLETIIHEARETMADEAARRFKGEGSYLMPIYFFALSSLPTLRNRLRSRESRHRWFGRSESTSRKQPCPRLSTNNPPWTIL